MKVLVAPTHYVISDRTGTEPTWAYNIICALAESYPIELDVVCGILNVRSLPTNVRFFQTGPAKGDLIGSGSFALRSYLKSRTLQSRNQIVHHMFPFNPNLGINLAAIIGDLRGKPLVIGPIQFPQEFYDATDLDYFAQVTKRNEFKRSLVFESEKVISRFITKPINLLHEKTVRAADALIFDSKMTLDLYRRLYRDVLANKILEVCPPCIRPNLFPPKEPDERSHFEILAIGHLVTRKGFQHLINAMPMVLKEIGDVRLRIVGDGPYKNVLKLIVDKLSLGNVVSFESSVENSALASYYHSCDIFVLPALSTTAFVYLEAQCCGRPVIGTDAGYIPELVVDGVTGLIVPRADVKELAESIIALLCDKQKRRTMGLNAHRFVRKKFTCEIVSDRIYDIYSKLCPVI